MAKINYRDMALKVIEMTCAMEAENISHVHSDRTKELLGKIYTYAHVGEGSCGNKHMDWKRELKKMYQYMKKEGIL